MAALSDSITLPDTVPVLFVDTIVSGITCPVTVDRVITGGGTQPDTEQDINSWFGLSATFSSNLSGGPKQSDTSILI